MGAKQVKSSGSGAILVLGPSKSGKTHLLECLSHGDPSHTRPTNGYHEVRVNGLRLVEFGGAMPWTKLVTFFEDPFRAIVYVQRSDMSLEESLEGQNELLELNDKLGLPVYYVTIKRGKGGVCYVYKDAKRFSERTVGDLVELLK
jgi:GTPase SAR1 family protein